MLSLILSWLFRLAFTFLLLFGAVEVFVQVRQKPLIIHKGTNETISIGRPGLALHARRQNRDERFAPDTLVSFDVKLAPGYTSSSSGGLSWGNELTFKNKARLDSMSGVWKKRGDSIKLDTQINIILNRKFDLASLPDGAVSVTGYETLPDGRIVSETIIRDEKDKQRGKVRRDTFADMRSVRLSEITGNAANNYRLVQKGDAKEMLRLDPSTTGQHLLFVLYKLVIFFFGAWLLLTLSSLFKKFYYREYFTLHNVKRLRNAGWCLLIPQLTEAGFYWGLLANIHPVKIMIKGTEEVKEVAGYEFIPGIDWTYVFLGLGALILSYVFKNGLSLKEEQALFI